MPKLPESLERSTIVKAIRAQDQGPQVVAYDQFVTDHLRKTGRSVQAADIAYSLLTLGVGWLVLFLAAALVEHWLTPHGFGSIARYTLFTLAALATAWHTRVSLWPLLTGRINPLYTAQAIETSAPTLKNGLINLLTLRGGKKTPTAVLATLEQHAAQGIASAPEEAVFDRTRLVRMAGALVVLLSAMAIYSLVSVKDPFVSAARIVAPWAKIAPPSRVRVTQVTPGDTTLVEGQSLNIEARVEGLSDDEYVFAVLTTSDGQRQDDRVPMAYDQQLDRYVVSLPTVGSRGQLGLSGEGRYRVAAGDGRSPDYDLKVLPAPTLVVTRVDYLFPAYTGLLDYSQEDAGDIRGIEGTRVTLHAQANSPIKSASVDFEGDGSYDLAMQIDGDANTATATFKLALRDDRQTPKHTSYLLRLKTPEGLVNTRPAKHKIEVYADYPPEVELVLPEEQERPVRLNETVVISGIARDPDFALADLRLYGECQGERVVNKRLLTRPVKGKHQAEFRFTPSQFGLQVGDRVDYWLEATDNRRPDQQTAVSQRQTFVITSPDPRDNQRHDEMADAGDQQGQPNQNNSGEQGDQSRQGQQGGQQGQENSGGQGQSEDSNSEGNKGQQEEGQPGESQPSDSDASESGNQNSGGQGQSTNDSGESQSSGQLQNGTSSNGSSGDQDAANQNQGNSGQQGNSGESDSGSPKNNPGQGNSNQGGQPSKGQQGGDKPGESGQQSEPSDFGDSQPVDNSGADDAEAFDRILDHLDKNQQPNPSADGNAGKQNQPNRDSAAQQDHQANPQGQGNASEGTGADTQGGDTQSQEQELGEEPGEQTQQSPGGKQETPRGDPSTAGSQGQPEGSPGSDPRQRPTKKQQANPAGKNSEQQDAPAPANGKQESDSQGDQSGDRPGGGDEGGGQRGQREGTGSSGENTAADEGAGKSSEQGTGESGDQAGNDQAADDPTGESGERPGDGTSKSDGAGDKPGGDQSSDNGSRDNAESSDNSDSAQQSPMENPSTGKPGDPKGQQHGEPSEDQGPATDQGDQQPSNNSSGELKPGEQQGPPPRGSSNAQSTAGGDVGGDKANLDYARQKTDLVLEKLSEQLEKQQVDEELLDSLGWNQDDLRRFVERWRQRKSAAQRPNASQSAKTQLDSALKSLGLKPKTLSSDTQRTADDLRNQASGRSSNVPLKFRQRMQRYNQGVSGAGD